MKTDRGFRNQKADPSLTPPREKAQRGTASLGMTATGAICIFLTAFVALAFLGGCKGSIDRDDADDRPRTSPATPPPAQISFENGEVILTMDEAAQKRMGIEVSALAGSSNRPQADVPATVLSVQDLASFRNGYVAALSQIEKSKVDIEVARKQYARAKSLFESDQNISAKVLESSEGNLRALETEERAAEQQLSLQGAMAEQQWGNVVAKWAMDGSPELDRILSMREVLIQVTLPFDQNYAAPKTLLVEVPGRTRAEATLISAFPRVDPRIQGRSFLYAAPAQPDFTPGVNLVSRLTIGNSTRGVLVLASAVVWSEGKAWAYLQTAARQFSRREVPTDSPVDAGYFVKAGFSPDSKVVTKGAQSLLSEEAVLEGYGGGESDDN
ncbi:MAG TPA: hypothetical protein VJN43_16850 [Bryobacteraceae bacterium]|nr:hypothetical protein [Bryobacteraceae bacterium]